MTSPTDASENGSPEPRREGAPPVVETVVRTGEPQADPRATHTMERSKKGRGTLIALLVVPPLLFLLVAGAYFLYALTSMNTQQEGPQRERGTNMASPSGRP
jgi:hypothetical protein